MSACLYNNQMDIQIIRAYLKRKLTDERIERLKRFQALRFRRSQHLMARLFFRGNLKALSVMNHSDKWGYHFYAPHYERWSPDKSGLADVISASLRRFAHQRELGSSILPID